MAEPNVDIEKEHALCKVILIGGFLGAGKTTLLKTILEWPGDLSSTAVLVNEFGQIGIDGELLQRFDTDIVELTNGCICCTMKGDLLKSVKEILDGFHPNRLFIETLPVNLYRLKGFALLEDKMLLVNHVGGRTEWVELDKKGSTRLAFIGWQVSKDQVLEDLKVCLKHDNT